MNDGYVCLKVGIGKGIATKGRLASLSILGEQ